MTSEARPGSPLWLGGEAAQHHSQMSEAQFVGGTGTVDRDHPYISRDRKHGDPFPLPRLDKDFAFTEDFNFDLRGLSSLHLQLVNEAIRSANGLAGVCMRAKHSALSFPAASRKRPTSVQVTMINDLVARILEVGPPPEGLREDDALKELAGASYLYEEANNLAKYDPEKIKIFKRRLHPLEARSLCSKDVEAQLKHFQHFVERSEEEILAAYPEGLGVEPYWDPQLKKSLRNREDLYFRLWKAGLLSFRRKRKALIAFFVVKKKDGMQRLICDARQANRCHRPPPPTKLSTPAAFGGLDLTEYNIMEQGFGEIFGLHDGEGPQEHPPRVACRGNEGDVGDCFYNFTIEELASWFCTFDSFSVERLAELGMEPTTIFDDDLQKYTPVQPGEVLIPCFRGVCMGWSWALHLAQSIVTHQASLSVNGDSSDLLLDKAIVPDISPCKPVIGVYVDNLQVIGGSASSVNERMTGIVNTFQQLGIPFVVSGDEALDRFETLGLVFDLERRCIRHRAARSWRLYMTTRALLRRGRIRGEMMRVWIGHVVHHFQLARCNMSVIHACYRFVEASLGKRSLVWPSVRLEMRMVLGLIFLNEADLQAPYHNTVYLGDSSSHGFSLMETTATELEVKTAMRCQERWRFVEAHVEVPDGEVTHGCTHARGQSPLQGLASSTTYGKSVRAKAEVHMKRKNITLKGEIQSTNTVTIEVPTICEPLRECWHKPGRYRLLVARPWKYKLEHINLKEARVLLMGLRRHCRSAQNAHCRLLSLSDNLSCVAFSKGRSSSYALNQLVRRSAAYCTFLGIRWHIRHIPTGVNTADAPSRWFDPSPPKKWAKAEHDMILRTAIYDSSVATGGAKDEYVGKFATRDIEPQRINLADTQCFSSRDKDFDIPDIHIPSVIPVVLPLFFLEVFAGSARLTSSMAAMGFMCLAAFDFRMGVEFDLTRPSTQSLLLALLERGLVWYIHFGLPGACWSRARKGIKNHVRARAREKVSLELTMFTIAACRIQYRMGWFFSIENPRGSRVWEFPPLVDLFGLHQVQFIHWSMCSYGSIYKQDTSLLTNMASLRALARACTKNHHHASQCGTKRLPAGCKVKSGNPTACAGEYPWGLAQAWALAVYEQAPQAAFQPDVSNFSRVVGQRFKEIAQQRRPHRQSAAEGERGALHLQAPQRTRAKAKTCSQPILFRQLTNQHSQWLKEQGA